eukprot:2852337-Amphidinium_carterae.1
MPAALTSSIVKSIRGETLYDKKGSYTQHAKPPTMCSQCGLPLQQRFSKQLFSRFEAGLFHIERHHFFKALLLRLGLFAGPFQAFVGIVTIVLVLLSVCVVCCLLLTGNPVVCIEWTKQKWLKMKGASLSWLCNVTECELHAGRLQLHMLLLLHTAWSIHAAVASNLMRRLLADVWRNAELWGS